MKRERALQLEPPEAQQPQRHDQVAPRGRQFHVGDPIPVVLTKDDLAASLGMSIWVLDRCRAEHSHPAIKELDAPGHPRFCGRTFKAWLDGTLDKPASRHFFGKPRSTRKAG